MKKLILCTALITLSLLGKVHAQENDGDFIYPHTEENTWASDVEKMTKTEKTFGVATNEIRIRDFVYLKDGKMILELENESDYQFLKNLDSVLMQFRKDIAFYKDSMAGNAGSLKIDYVTDVNHSYKKIRFKKYAPNGISYLKNDQDISVLKIENDTVRILLRVKGQEVKTFTFDNNKKRIPYKYSKPKTLSVTFCLNNYYDIDKIIADSSLLRHTIDTLALAAQDIKAPYYTIGYNPGGGQNKMYNYWKFRKVNYIVDEVHLVKSGDILTVNGGIGASLIKNTIAPIADIAIEVDKRWRGAPHGGFAFLRLSASPYLFFDKSTPGHTVINPNWFANAEVGIWNKEKKSRSSIGAGYLFSEQGGYFQNTTMKLFMNTSVSKDFTISPEIIFNNNFKQVFPGITLRIY